MDVTIALIPSLLPSSLSTLPRSPPCNGSGQSTDCAAGLTNTGPARNNLNGTFGLGYYNGVGGELEVELANGEPVGGKAGIGGGYGVHFTRQSASGALMQGGFGGYKSPAIWEYNPQQPGEIRIGPSFTLGVGAGTVGAEFSAGGGMTVTNKEAGGYFQAGTSITISPVIPRIGTEVKFNIIDFSVKAPSLAISRKEK
ncbi:hypothetical protein [Variovorax sp. JS1663]|uniref:hypothetical protein n=1 Tax=Variovorax sp. JS1663 TaxID=1851577 RepID=UPI0018654533|nr:hypothetical protein [Variovorax sp. JS1663]